MQQSFFRVVRETPDDPDSGIYAATEATIGPWSTELQHGGPPNALLVHAAERSVRAATGRDDLVALRIATDFLGPVPVAEVTTHVRPLRSARSAVLVEATLSAGERVCLSSRIWFLRVDENLGLAAPAVAVDEPADGPSDELTALSFGYGEHLESRYVSGAMDAPGPAAAWLRGRVPIVDDETPSSLARVVLVADSGNGISRVLDWNEWSFMNVDLDVHLLRPMAGTWTLLDAVTTIGPTGAGLARSTISDGAGLLGAGLQTLLIAPFRR